MGIIQGVNDKIKRIQTLQDNISKVPEVINSVVSSKKDVLLSLNRDQMLLGRNSDGEVLGPSYLQDPYFKTPEKAKNYAEMKYKLEGVHNNMITNPQLFPNKNKDTPNLIVTGPFQDSMFILLGENEYEIGSTYIDTPDIESKYNHKVFGIAPESRAYFYRQWLLPVLIKSLKNGL